MKVLVTGATGFLGSRLTEALMARGHTVRILRRAQSSLKTLAALDVEHVVGDILDKEAMARAVAGCDAIFHAAALSSYWRSSRDAIYRVNVEGTRTVMQAALRAGVARVVHTSSVAAITPRPVGAPADESTAFDPRSVSFAYAHSKHLAETEVLRAVDQGLPAVLVNPAIVIGAGDHYMVSGSMVVQVARRYLPAVPPGGACVADADAVVEGHLAAAERGRIGERYILGGENLTYRQITATIAAVAGKSAPKWVLPRWLLGPGAIAVDAANRLRSAPPLTSGDQVRLSAHFIYFDSSKAVRELSYPLLPFRGAVEKAYRWYLEHGYLV